MVTAVAWLAAVFAAPAPPALPSIIKIPRCEKPRSGAVAKSERGAWLEKPTIASTAQNQQQVHLEKSVATDS